MAEIGTRARRDEGIAGPAHTPGTVDFDSEEIIERLAELVVKGVPLHEIASAFGVLKDKIINLVRMPTFMLVIEEKRRLLGMKYDDTNNTWDSVELLALKKVKDKLNSFNVDPDFALRTAIYANRAQRRGGNGNQVLGVPAEGRAIINLNQTIIQKLVQINQTNSEEVKNNIANTSSMKLLPSDQQMKVIDIANPADIEKLLGGDEEFGLKDVHHIDGSLGSS